MMIIIHLLIIIIYQLNNHLNNSTPLLLLSSSSSSRKISSFRLPVNINCDQALNKCTSSMRCALDLNDYGKSCYGYLHNKTSTCSEQCSLSIVSLSTTPEGYNYIHCDCLSNDYCYRIRKKTFDCVPRLINTYNNKKTKVISCRSAVLNCREDNLCKEAMDQFNQHCDRALIGKECTNNCNKSLTILKNQKSAASLSNCYCERDHDIGCSRRKYNIKRLCLNPDNNGDFINILSSSMHWLYIIIILISIKLFR